MTTTRQNIISTAQHLFVERGYENVSLRDISGECGISHGNLTYYFNTKEDLVIAVMGEVFEGIYSRFALATCRDITDLLDHIRSLCSENDKYLFYFRNMLSLANSFPELAARQRLFREQNYWFYLRSFKELVDAGQMRDDIPNDMMCALAMRMIMVQVEWSLKGSPTEDPVFEGLDYFTVLSTSIYPYLTEEGRTRWDAFFAEM